MSAIPDEFDPEYILARSEPEVHIYRDEVNSQEPMKSMYENNPEIYFVPPKRGGDWGQWEFKAGSYYDTTTGDKHPYWKDKELPRPTKKIELLRRDMIVWGYCMIEDAISSEQIEILRERVLGQAEGERLAGIAQKTPSGQNVNCCINKGRCFELFVEQHPDIAQGGPLAEQLVTEALGRGWICTSLIASISLKGGVPQALHQDQAFYPESASPMIVNILSAITDIGDRNGGTLVIPGSHSTMADAARQGKPVGKLPPAINLDAKAGTMVITDGRLLHGTGINHTEDPRVVMLNGMQKPWMRQQENWMLSVRPEVLERASDKLLHRMGYQATTGAQTNEGHGFGARGMPGELVGATVGFRLAADQGEYLRIGELGPKSTEEELNARFTLRKIVGAAREGGSAPVAITSSGIN